MTVQQHVDWTAMVEAIKQRIADVENAANDGKLPPFVVSEVKSVVDHCRTTLWGVMVGTELDSREGYTAIVTARLQRIGEMCQRIQEDVAAGRIGSDTPGVATCYAFLVAAERALRALPKSAAPTK